MPSFPGTRSSDYHCRVVCGACVRVCPNRCNEVVTVNDAKLIVHVDQSCNECGNCACHCVEPCQPYKDRITFFHNAEALADSTMMVSTSQALAVATASKVKKPYVTLMHYLKN